MSYRNPQRNIDNKYAVMTQGINQYYTNLQNVLTKAAKGKEENKKKRIEAKKAFQKDIDKKLSPFDKQVEGKMEEVKKALGEDNTNKGLYEDLINELEYVRKALAYQLRDQDLTTSEIAFKVESAGNNVNQLTQALVNLSAAEGQYSNAISKKPNEEGYLLSGGPNQELAQIIKNVDSGKSSATLFNNNKKKELGEYNFNGNYSLVDYASGSIENGQLKEGTIPEGVFDLSSQELTQAVTNGENLFNTVKIIEPGIQEAFNTSVSEMIKADPTLVGANGKIDQIKLKEKLSTPEGKEHIESITKIDGNDVTRNYWRSIAPDSVTDFENWDSYANEDIFTNYLIEQAAGSEPVKGTVLEFEERQKVESPQMSKVEDVVEAGKETIAAPTNLEQGNIPSIVKPKNDPLGLFKNAPEKTVVEEVVETPEEVSSEETLENIINSGAPSGTYSGKEAVALGNTANKLAKNKNDFISNTASKIFDYETKSGSGTGTGLKDFGFTNKKYSGKEYDKYRDKNGDLTKEGAVEIFETEYMSKVPKIYPNEIREQLADYKFNTSMSTLDLMLLANGDLNLRQARDEAEHKKLWSSKKDEIEAKMKKDPTGFKEKIKQAKRDIYKDLDPDKYEKTWKDRIEIFG